MAANQYFIFYSLGAQNLSKKQSKYPDWVTEDLARSGLTLADAAKLQLVALDETETKELTGTILTPSYGIPYHTIKGVDTNYFRLRLKDYEPKYWQQKNTLPKFYYPCTLTWEKIAEDTSETIYITEGEKKAACAAKYGLACIGLGGVWSWKSKKAELPHIPDFKDVDWRNRHVVLVFDSDLASNPNVLGALHALSRVVVNLGAKPSYVQLPSNDGEKVGLDDFLLAASVDAFHELELHEFDEASQLWKMNDDFAVIQDVKAVYDLHNHRLISVKDFLVVYVSNRKIDVTNAKGQPEKKYLGRVWLDWPFRRQHTTLTYAPGQPLITSTGAVNTWQKPQIEPRQGSIAPWSKLLDYFFSGDAENRAWFESWCAYPLQNLGAKMFSAVLFWGREGAGKSLTGKTLGKLYGENFSEIQRQELYSAYNDWAINKQFILVEEATGSEKREDSDKLKHLITRQRIRVSEKYVPNYFCEDRANYFFNSNHPDAFFLGENDRRFFILQVPGELLPLDFYSAYDRWLKGGKGCAALLCHLLNYDCSKFDPNAPAPLTTAKKDMQALSASDLDLWCRELRESPESILKELAHKDLFTTHELLALQRFQSSGATTLIALSKALRRANFPAPRAVKLRSGEVKKLIAVKSVEAWARRTVDEWANYYGLHQPPITATSREKKYQ